MTYLAYFALPKFMDTETVRSAYLKVLLNGRDASDSGLPISNVPIGAGYLESMPELRKSTTPRARSAAKSKTFESAEIKRMSRPGSAASSIGISPSVELKIRGMNEFQQPIEKETTKKTRLHSKSTSDISHKSHHKVKGQHARQALRPITPELPPVIKDAANPPRWNISTKIVAPISGVSETSGLGEYAFNPQ